MVKILINIDDKINHKLTIYKEINFCRNKSEAINRILKEKLDGVEF